MSDFTFELSTKSFYELNTQGITLKDDAAECPTGEGSELMYYADLEFMYSNEALNNIGLMPNNKFIFKN